MVNLAINGVGRIGKKVIMLARLAAKASEFASIWDVTATISVLQKLGRYGHRRVQ